MLAATPRRMQPGPRDATRGRELVCDARPALVETQPGKRWAGDARMRCAPYDVAMTEAVNPSLLLETLVILAN